MDYRSGSFLFDLAGEHKEKANRPGNRYFVTPNHDRGIRPLVKRLAALKPQLIVLAASGGYEFLATGALAEALRPQPRPLLNQAHQVLKAVLSRRQQVVKMIGQEENHLEKTFIPAVRQDIQPHLTCLRQRLKELNRDLDDQIRQCPLWRDRDRMCQSVPGIGPVVSRAVIDQLPEIGTLPGKKTVALTWSQFITQVP